MISNLVRTIVTPRESFRAMLKAPLQVESLILAFLRATIPYFILLYAATIVFYGTAAGTHFDGTKLLWFPIGLYVAIILSLFLFASLNCYVGRFFGGVASFTEVFAALVTSIMPLILPLVALSVLGLGPIVGACQLALFVIFLSEAHQIDSLAAVACCVISAFLTSLPFAAFALLGVI